MTLSEWTAEVAKRARSTVRSFSREVAGPESRFSARRTGLASLLFAVFRSGDARAATVNADSVKFAFGSRWREIALRDIEAIRLNAGKRWGGVRLGHAAGGTTVSGLARSEARVLADAIEMARVDWWRSVLAPQIGALRSVHDASGYRWRDGRQCPTCSSKPLALLKAE